MDISSLQFPTSHNYPVFDYSGAGLKGDSVKAGDAYGQCILSGGNENDCGASAWQAGVTNGKIISTDNGGVVDKVVNLLGRGFGVPNLDIAASTATGKANLTPSWLSNPTRIITAVIGIVFIGAALFMFGVASFNPVSIALDKMGALNE